MARPKSSGKESKSAQIRALLGTGMSPADIAKKVGCSTNLVYVVKSTAASAARGARRGPGRPPKAGRGVDGIEGILAAVKNSQRDRESLRAALERIRDLATAALA